MIFAVLKFLFWIFLFVVFYTYIGYGIVLYTMVKIKHLFKKEKATHYEDGELPEVTLLIAAYNEEDVVDEKMNNCITLLYPQSKLHIVWVTDGSNDRTNEFLGKWPQAKVIFTPERKGKTAALNHAMQVINTPITIFTDANTMLNYDAVRVMVDALKDEKVGCIAGEKRIVQKLKDNASGSGEGLYWKYESMLKSLDSLLFSACGAAGELFAIRTELYQPMPEKTLLDDFMLSMRIVMKGYRIVYTPNAYATENSSASMKEEEKRKIRIAAGGIDAVWKLRPLLNPFRYGIFTFQYISHRVLRWTLTPFFLFLLLPINLALLFDEECQLFYAVILLFQIIFYALSALGYLMQKLQLKNKIVFVPYYFVFMNLNVIKGISYLYKQRNNKNGGAWEKAKRAS